MKWRIFVILVSIILLLYVNDYLHDKYSTYAMTAGHPEPFLISEKLFYWFVTGFMFGIIVISVMFEGEFLLGLRKWIREIEAGAEQEIRNAGKKIGKEIEKEEKALGLKPKKKKKK